MSAGQSPQMLLAMLNKAPLNVRAAELLKEVKHPWSNLAVLDLATWFLLENPKWMEDGEEVFDSMMPILQSLENQPKQVMQMLVPYLTPENLTDPETGGEAILSILTQAATQLQPAE